MNVPADTEPRPVLAPDARIVGVGASAGGLESLERLFSALPADTGMAFVVVQHLSPDFRSMMDELISRYSEMPVLLAQDKMALRPNHIFLLPPRKEMIVRDRRLVLTDKDPNAFPLPIDTFFRSLAIDAGDRAVAIVLSGSGSDGSRGAVDVHKAGGTVLVETPETARFDSMPQSVLATGICDGAHPPGDLARVLCGLPPAQAPVDEEPLRTSRVTTRNGGDRRRVVVVDDQEDSREMLKLLLEARDHEVMDAADGPSALEVIEKMRPDVAFIDIGLPVMTGYEIAQRIRAQRELDGVVLVALTGYGGPGDVVAVREAGFDEHLVKPADLSRIERILERPPAGAIERD